MFVSENLRDFKMKIIGLPQDFAGTRSDFVVVGHPEYNLGKAGQRGKDSLRFGDMYIYYIIIYIYEYMNE